MTTAKTKSLNIRLGPDLYESLQRMAIADDRSLSSLTRRWLTAIVAEDLATEDRRIRPTGDAQPFEGGHA
jgi:hypothetical protein